MSDDITCGLEEHEHTDECYAEELCCTISDEAHVHTDECYDQEELVCTISDEAHVHGDECYQLVLVCDLPEHTHSEDCYESASPETHDAEFIARIPTLTGRWTNDLIAVAQSQLGYTESTTVMEGENGYTMYGAAFEMPYANWDAAFVAWCLDRVNVPAQAGTTAYFPRSADTEQWMNALRMSGDFWTGDGELEPKAGDLVFFRLVQDSNRSFVAIALDGTHDAETGKLTYLFMLMGDNDGSVAEKQWTVSQLDILGWARLPKNPANEASSDTDAATEAETTPAYDPVVPDPGLIEGESNCNAYVAGTDASSKKRSTRSADSDEPLDISSSSFYIDSTGINILWHESHNAEETGSLPWKPLPTDGTKVPADAHLRIEVQYANVSPETLAAHNYQIVFIPSSQITDLMASGYIKVGGENRGTITAQDDHILLEFDPNWVDDLVTKNESITNPANKKTIYGDFYFQGELDLAELDKPGGHKLLLGPVEFDFPVDDDAVAKFGNMDFEKQMNSTIVKDDTTGKYYLEYILTVTAGDYGNPAVVVRDSMQASHYLVMNPSPYVGVNAIPSTVSHTASGNVPVEKVVPNAAPAGSVHYEIRSGATPSGNASAGYDLVWTIGDMDAGETRTLTYRVEISETYIGIKHSATETDAFVNEAALTSNGYPKKNDIETFVPKVDLNLQKQRTSLKDNLDGTFTATYRVMVQAPRTNSYALTNLKFTDDFGDRTWDNYGAGVVNNIHYDKDSVRITDGNGNPVDVSDNHNPNPVWYSIRAAAKPGIDESNSNVFDLYIGDLAPGEIRYIEYTMTINANECKLTVNGPIGIGNRGEIWDDADKHDGRAESLGFRDTNSTVDNQYWDRKTSAGQLSTAQTVNITGADGYFLGTRTYDDSKERLDTDSAHPDSFKLPSGAYQYKVVVNESGEWDMSKAIMFDQLTPTDGKVYLQYTGYARVDVYDKLTTTNPDGTERPIANKGDDNAVLNYLNGVTPDKTYWVKLSDGTSTPFQSFGYTPAQLGLTDPDAYVITYYAVPSAEASSANKVVAGNAFQVSGTVIGPGGLSYVLQPMQSVKSVSVVGGNSYAVSKKPWYYAPPSEDEPTVQRFTETLSDKSYTERENYGATYWAIVVDGGAKLPNNVTIRETTEYSSSTYGNRSGIYPLSVRMESLVGAYVANLGQTDGVSNDVSTLENVAAFEEMVALGQATKLEEGVDYTVNSYSSNRYCEFKSIRDISIPADYKIYFIIRADLTVPLLTNSVSTFNNWYRYAATPGAGTTLGPAASIKVPVTGTGVEKTAGNVFKVTSNNGDKTFGAYDRTTKKYEVLPGNQISKSRTDNNRRYQELQNSLLVVADSLEELWAAYDGNNGTYQYYNDQVLNYTYQDGMYVTWQVKVNPDRVLFGPYTVIDTLPAGVELCYVRGYSGITGALKVDKPTRSGDFNVSTQITGFSDAYADWDEHYVLAPTVDDAANWLKFLTNYYTRGNQIAIHMPSLQANNTPTFQIVCRVTDPAVYYQDVEFTNQASLIDRFGREVSTGSDTVWLRTDAVSKANLADVGSAGILTDPIMPYEITINPDAADMDLESDVMSIPMVDFMSSNLHMDMDSLRIYRDSISDSNLLYSGKTVQKTDEDGNPLYYDSEDNPTTVDTGKPIMMSTGNTTDATSIRISSEATTRTDEDGSVSGTMVKFHNLPDEAKLIVTYDVSATLSTGGVGNSFSNKAYWEGYEDVGNGETKEDSMIFEAGASAGANNYGGLQITKHDGNDESIRLSGATFALYRAQYECYPNSNIPVVFATETATGAERELSFEEYEDRLSETIRDMLNIGRSYSFKYDEATDEYEFYWVNDNDPDDVIVGMGNESHPGYTITHRSLYYNMNGSATPTLLEYSYYLTNIQLSVKFDQEAGFTYRHNILRDSKGRAICEPEPIDPTTVKTTDANGIITYGLTEGEDAIHFNKVYCVKEIAAPEGYVLDETEYFFVIPNDGAPFQDGVTNFFYRTEWPSNVHIVSRTLNDTPTYFLDVFNYKGRASVIKDFGGNGNAARPGAYSFAIYSKVDEAGSPVISSQIGDIQTVTYRESDFTTTVDPVTGETVYHLTAGAASDKTATFDNLIFGQSYFIFEVNDAGYPIEQGKTGTVNEMVYHVSYSVVGPNGTRADGSPMLSNEVIPVCIRAEGQPTQLIVPVLHATNAQYDASVTKQFASHNGEPLDAGLVGTYSFGIWPSYRVTNGIPAGQPLQTVSIAWEHLSDTDVQKTAVFKGLVPGETYYIFELAETGEAALPDGAVSVSGYTFVAKYLNGNSFTVEYGEDERPNVTVQNNATFQLPHTGGIGTTPFTLGGIALLSIACLGYFACVLLRRRREEDRS